MSSSCSTTSARVPVFLVSGYAGVGKTHVVNRLLARCRSRGLRAGVIAHRQAEEFGIEPTPLRADLAAYSDAVYDFGSGCLCCSPKGELQRLLHALAAAPTPLDVLFIRTGPLAAPLVFAKAVICSSDEVSAAFELASIVAVVDPRYAPRHLDLAGPEGVTRMGAFDRSEMQTWLGVLRVASQPPAPAMGAGSTLAADGGDGGAEAENLGTGVGTD